MSSGHEHSLDVKSLGETAPSSLEYDRVPLHRTLYFRLALTFAFLLAATGLLQLKLTTDDWEKLSLELEQEIHWDLAEEVALKLQDDLKLGVNSTRLRRRLYDLAVLNPKIEPYLLDADGNIVLAFDLRSNPIASNVDLAPIHQALSPIAPETPLLGSDPHGTRKRKVFSVAPILIAGQPGYLYLILNSSTYEFLTRINGQFYVAQAGVLGGAIVFAAALVLGLFVFRYLSRHFYLLAAAMQRFAKGEFHWRLPVKSQDEVGQLAKTLNFMAARIEEQTAALVERDILRRNLIATIAHDLRGPLTSIRGFVETILLKRNTISAQEQEKYLRLVLNGINSQFELVRDLMELSALEANERAPNLEDFAIDELVDEIVERHTHAAEARRIVLSHKCELVNPVVTADIVMIERVLTNLIGNAIRYTPEGGEVEVHALAARSGIAIIIRDTGIGIPSQELPLIFDSFYRANKNRPEDPGGTGLGLAIVKKLLDLHGVSIEVSSQVDVGTTFRFVLPQQEQLTLGKVA